MEKERNSAQEVECFKTKQRCLIQWETKKKKNVTLEKHNEKKLCFDLNKKKHSNSCLLVSEKTLEKIVFLFLIIISNKKKDRLVEEVQGVKAQGHSGLQWEFRN